MANRPTFGIMTAPQHVEYAQLLAAWRAADREPAIEHAWLFDHLLPILGDENGPILEGWTLLAALAAQTKRLRLGLLVTSNRFRPPAMLAKIAATVDIISSGRLDFGIGVGGRPIAPWPREYSSHGLPFHDTEQAVGTFAEACTVIRRLWTEDEPFDFDGSYIKLVGALCNPKPVQQPNPPIMIGGRSTPVLRLAAEHADIWNTAGDSELIIGRSKRVDQHCEAIGRDPATLQRSVYIRVSYRQPERTRTAIEQALEGGFSHVVLGLNAPFPENVVPWAVDKLIAPFTPAS